MNIRSTLVKAAADWLESLDPPVSVRRDASDEVIEPPYALFRVGGAENMYPGQAEVWDITLLCAVAHDADATTVETAQAEAEAVYDMISDCEEFKTFSAGLMLLSAWEITTTELTVQDGRWQHIAGFRAICAPLPEPEV